MKLLDLGHLGSWHCEPVLPGIHAGDDRARVYPIRCTRQGDVPRVVELPATAAGDLEGALRAALLSAGGAG